MTYEPFTKEQETAVQMFHRICELDRGSITHEQAFELRLKLAGINAANGWTMTDVAFAARENFWPPKYCRKCNAPTATLWKCCNCGGYTCEDCECECA